MRSKIFISLLLAVVTVAIYWPARHFDLLFYDDSYFLDAAKHGLNWRGLQWAMTAVVVSNWHPMTILSFLLFGADPGVEHLANVIIHAANAALLFLVLAEMTSMIWRSAAVAAIFSWHPLRLESVAWIAERKDVLFLFFMLLCLWCYARYAREKDVQPSTKAALRKQEESSRRHAGWSRAAYAGALIFFGLSFMSKAMVVTLPFLLLLLDLWPLRRFNVSSLRGLVMEKIPFFALTIFFCLFTFWIQYKHQAVASVTELGIFERGENATLSYINYLGYFAWPTQLSIFYQYPEHFDKVRVLLSALVLLGISVLCLWEISRRPYLATGWFWYLGTMVPVIGLVQIGIDAMSDRYTYLPLIGPVISLVWLTAEWARTNQARMGLAALAVVILLGCALSTRKQLPYWQNSVTLFDRAIEVDPTYVYPHIPLALGLVEQKRLREATVEYQMSFSMLSNHNSMVAQIQAYQFLLNTGFASVLSQMGYEKRAHAYLEAALKINPDSLTALNNLAWSLATSPAPDARDGARAVQLAEHACQLTKYKQPIFIGTLAAAYAEAGRFDEAIATAQKAIANAQERGETALAQRNQQLLDLYRTHQAYHEGQNDVWTATPKDR